MTREIKFRAEKLCKEGEEKEWVYGYFIRATDSMLNPKGNGEIIKTQYFIFNDSVLAPFEINPKTVGQYTGLKDKNGEEIWEGDLATDAHDEHYEVVFSDASFAVVHDGNVIEPLYEVASGIEIIGKIYENPELLTN